jgi:DNA mismatch repair protein MSH6
LHSDDDEFNPASEQDEDETRSVKSFRSSSSRRSAPSSSDTEGDFIEDDEEDNPRKSKSKPAAKSGRKAKGKVAVADNFEASDAGSAFTLLTAAERREQGKKLEKKSTEEPFGFLQDVRDVRRISLA